jgi:OmpA-OmpF porin, OOP family
MKKPLLCTVALCAILAAAPAEADGLYIGAFGGVSFLDEATGSADGPAPGVSYTVDVESDTGWAGGLVVGYGFSEWLRAEGELSYRQNGLDQAKLGPIAVDLDGDTTALSVMGNVWFDLPLGGPVRPFLGGGLGMSQVSLNDVEVPALGGAQFVDDSDWVFAYQLGGGVAYRVAPGIDITAEYRYFGTENPEFNLDAIPTTGEFEYSSHSVLFGIRYSFNPT